MFKKQSHILSILLLSFLLLVGCNTAATTTPDSNTTATTETTGNAESQGTVDADLEASLEEAIQTLSTSVSDFLNKINNLTEPTGTDEDIHSQYLEFDQELADLDVRIDELDDTLDSKIAASQISRETYNRLHKELESLEDLVDSAEDQLERLFGIND